MNILNPHGLEWGFKVFDPRGKLIDEFGKHNLAPIEARDFMTKLALNLTSPVPTWYLSIYEGDYTPTDDVTAATLGGLATEITAYTPSTRPAFVPGTVASGAASNAASLAEFVFTAAKTVRCVAMTSAQAKGSGSGVLLSIVRLPSPKAYDIGSKLMAFAGPSVLSGS